MRRKRAMIQSGPRMRVEVNITTYCEKDRRKRAFKRREVRYTDGRRFVSTRYYNGHNRESLFHELKDYYQSFGRLIG